MVSNGGVGQEVRLNAEKQKGTQELGAKYAPD